MRWCGFLSTGGMAMSQKPSYEQLEKRIQELEAIEAERKENDTMLQRLFNLSIDMLCVANLADGHYMLTNKAFTETLGYSSDELLREPFLNFVHPDDQAATMDAAEKLSRGELVAYFENRYCCKNGSIKWLSWTSKPVPEEGLTYAVVRDITDRKKAEDELKRHRDHLEELISERTDNLQKSNEELKKEIAERKRAEEALRESEERFRSFMESATEGFSYWDPDLKLIEVNGAALNLFGGEERKENIVGKNILEIEPMLQGSELYNWFREVLKSGKPLFLYDVVPHPQFGNRVLNVKAFKVGEGLGMIAEDVTERKQAEEALRESEEKLREIFENVNEMIGTLNADGTIRDANKKIEDIFGFKPEEVIGKQFTEIPLYHPDHLENIMQMHLEAVSGTLRRIVDFVALRKDGTEIHVEANTSVIKEDGKIKYILVVVRDITERKRADEALKESERSLKKAQHLAHLGSWELNLKDNTVEFSDEMNRIFGNEGKNRFKLETALEALPPGDREKVNHSLSEFLFEENIEQPPQRFRFRRKDGEMRWGIASLPEIKRYGRNGIPEIIIGTIQDITDQRRAEEEKEKLEIQLQQSRKREAIGTLAGGIAHEFNNILGIIVGNTELAMDGVPEWNTARYNLDEIRTACLRARDVVKQILAFSRQTKKELKPVSINRIIDESLKLLRSSIPTFIEIRKNIRNENDIVNADPTQINQIVFNLCTNAAFAMREEGGILEIDIENVTLDKKTSKQYHDLSPGLYVKLTVSDTGCGIEQKIIERIFDPYFTTKQVDEGSGMGLAVVHGIVRSHGGDIRVHSKPSLGATFEVLLPVIEADFTHEVEPREPLIRGSERILFVDDEESLVYTAKHTLGALGYDVVTEKDPINALETFEEQPYAFDIVITDMTMPNMTGDRFAKKIMEIRSDIPIVLCTGYSERMSSEQAEEMGIKAFLMKPTLIRELAKTIRKLLDERSK